MPEPPVLPGGPVDVHAHLLPGSVLDELRTRPEPVGVRLHEGPAGPVLEFPGGAASRPVFPAIVDVETRLRWLDEAGVARQWVGPWFDAVGYSLPAAQGAAWSRLLNEALADLCRSHPRLMPLATVPLQSGRAAAAELRYAVERLGMRAAMVGTSLPLRDLGDARCRPLFRKAAGLGVPVFLHPMVHGHARRYREPQTRYLVEYPFATCTAVLDLLFGGVFDELPALRLVLAHGGGTLLHQAGRIRHGLRSLPELQGRPPAALERALEQCWFDLVVHSEAELRTLLAQVPIERVLMGSDAPFALGLADPVRRVEAMIPDPGQRRQVLAGNAERLLQPDR
jgi:aminocarboxymuconate-semialdehyde decarboxylase